MVRVTIKSDFYNHIEFDFTDCEVAGKFMEVAMNAAVNKVTFEVTKGEEPQEESRFINPELEDVPADELAEVNDLF